MEPMEPEDDGIGAALRQAVATYCVEWRNPNLPPFAIYRHTRTSWHHTPESASAGCYAAYAADGRLLYVGKSSLQRIGDRLHAHFHANPPRPWIDLTAHFRFVTVSSPGEASALEEYLIGTLHPAFNVVGGHRP